MNCMECGALLPSGSLCRDYFDACLAKEFGDRTYWPVHNMTVAAYMLQHPSLLSRQGWLTMRQALAQFVQEGISDHHELGKEMQNHQRDFRFNTGEPISLNGIVWTRTIADIRLGNAETYIADVRAWAKAILRDTENVL